MPKYAARLSVFVLMLLMLCGCQKGSGITWSSIYTQQPSQTGVQQAELPSDQDELRVSMPVSGGPWDPAVNTSQAMQGLMQLVYETPVRLDSALKPQEQLVSWTVGADGTTWRFKIRSGVYFQDGSPMMAADIVRSLDRILSVGKDGPYGWILDELLSWSAQDESTLTVTSAKGGYGALYAMVFPVMKTREEGYPLGTGPYRLASYEAGETLELTAQEYWWRSSPRITTVRAVARESSESEMATFQLGELDIARTKSVTTAQYREAGVSATQDYMTQGYDALFFNFDKPLMADAIIRGAIARAVDRQDLIANIYQNHAVATDFPVPPDSWLHEIRLLGQDYDAAAAWNTLEDTGFVDVDADGIFDLKPMRFRAAVYPQESAPPEAPDTHETPEPETDWNTSQLEGMLRGESLTDPVAREAMLEPLILLTNYDKDNPVRRDAALRLRDQLQNAGVPVEVKSVEMSELPGLIEEGLYDIALLGYQIPLSGDLSFLLSSRYEGEQGGYSVTRFADETLDALLESLSGARSDTDYKNTLLAIEDRINQTRPFVGLYFRMGTLATRDSLRLSGMVREDKPFRAIEEWYFVE